jgi:glycerol-3-phosphate acyltransferase PlsY
MDLAAVVLVAYLIGSVSFAVLVSRAFALPDPHTYGSGNPGATNVLRTGRKAAAALTLIGDTFKGWFAVALTQQHVTGDPVAVAVAALAVTLGHMYPVFHRFRGGKGVSTALGILLALNLPLAAGTAATWLIVAFFFRISSLAALIAAGFAASYSFFLYGMNRLEIETAVAVTVLSLLLVWRHRGNIRKLLAGTEERLGRHRPQAEVQDTEKSSR